VALTVTITSPTESASTTYTLTGEVSGVAAPIDEQGYRVNGNAEVAMTPTLGAFSVVVTLREGGNSVAVRAKKGVTEVTEAIPVDVPDEFRGLTTGDELIQLLPRSLWEVE
jgi:hypothetical protein